MSALPVPPVRRLLKRLAARQPVVSGPLRLTHGEVEGQRVIFCTDKKDDPIQKAHRKGRFYEAPELGWLKAVFPAGGTFVDIGANVGNHTLYAALMLKAGRVIPFEPNPLAYGLLVQNVLVNGLADVVELSMLGVGVSDRHEGGFAMETREKNLGGAKMLAGAGEIEVFPGHDLLAGSVPDLIKIDVEGMEISVLSGLEPLLERCRPAMLVEVDNENDAAFRAWVSARGYTTVATHQRYRTNKNHLIADTARGEALRALRALGARLGATASATAMEPEPAT